MFILANDVSIIDILQIRQGNIMTLYTIVSPFGTRQTQGRRFEEGLLTQATTH